jgi:hypothetical protein
MNMWKGRFHLEEIEDAWEDLRELAVNENQMVR